MNGEDNIGKATEKSYARGAEQSAAESRTAHTGAQAGRCAEPEYAKSLIPKHTLGSPSQQYMGNIAESAHHGGMIRANVNQSANELRILLAGSPDLRLIGDALVTGSVSFRTLEEFVQRWKYVTSQHAQGL